MYLYRAVDSTGATIDFLLSSKRDAAAAERFLAKSDISDHPAFCMRVQRRPAHRRSDQAPYGYSAAHRVFGADDALADF